MVISVENGSEVSKCFQHHASIVQCAGDLSERLFFKVGDVISMKRNQLMINLSQWTLRLHSPHTAASPVYTSVCCYHPGIEEIKQLYLYWVGCHADHRKNDYETVFHLAGCLSGLGLTAACY